MKPIYYLSHSDISREQGFIFPNELLRETYSRGIWIIDLKPFDNMPDSFFFDAVDNNQLITLKMTRVNGSIFQVETIKYGKFYFRIVNTIFPYREYIGKSKLLEPGNILYQVVPIDIQKLENISLKHSFFFVGRIDSELE